MESFILLNLAALWLVALLLLSLSLRLLRLHKAQRAATVSPPHTSPRETRPLLGHLAPAFTAFTLESHRVSHADYLGQEALFLFLSTSCSHCRTVLPEIERVGAKLLQRGVKVACIFQADAEKTRAYCEELGLTLPILLAPKEVTSFHEDYNPKGSVPAFVAIDREGIVTHEGIVNRREETWRTFVQAWQAYPILAKSSAFYR